MTGPIRGQRRRGVPSLVLPGDPDGCGWIAGSGHTYTPCGVNAEHQAQDDKVVRYVGRPTHETVLDLVCRLLLEKKKHSTPT